MPVYKLQAGPVNGEAGGTEMKKEMTGKGSALSAVTALLMVLMMTVVMTLAGTFAVFADDTDPDPWQTNNRIRDVSEKQEITFRGEGQNNGPPMPPLPGHVPNGDQDADPDDIYGTDDVPGSPNLSDIGDDGGIGNMYPGLSGGNNNNENNSNHEIDNTSGDGLGPGPSEDDQLSSGPPEEEGKEPSGQEKDKTGDLKIEGAAGTGKNQPETGGNDAVRVADSDNDKSGTDGAKGSGSTDSSAASAESTGTGSPNTGDDNGLADAATLLILSMACLTAMMHSRRNTETDRQDH